MTSKTENTPKPYPSWVCVPCGTKYGHGMPKDHLATFHHGTCGICGQEAIVTEPRDFGHLKGKWVHRVSA
jgi:hypothetical protein